MIDITWFTTYGRAECTCGWESNTSTSQDAVQTMADEHEVLHIQGVHL